MPAFPSSLHASRVVLNIAGNMEMKRNLSLLLALPALLAGCVGSSERGSLPKARKAAAQIAKGTLTADAQGVVTLPAGLAGASTDGRAYVTTMPSGKQWILFCTWRGKGANLTGWLHTAGDTPAVGSDVSVITDRVHEIGPAEVTIESALGKSWYKVSRSMD